MCKLAADTAGIDIETDARQLHGQGRTADAASAGKRLERRPAQGIGIDPGVGIEMLVFVQQGGLNHRRRNPREGQTQTILVVGGKGKTQQVLLAVVISRRVA